MALLTAAPQDIGLNVHLPTVFDTLTTSTPPPLGKERHPPAPHTTPINGTSRDCGLCRLIEVSADSVCVPHGE
jgi:hypothetical protein